MGLTAKKKEEKLFRKIKIIHKSKKPSRSYNVTNTNRT